MSDELTQQLIQQWQSAAEAAADKPDAADVSKTFGDFITAQLDQEN